jgi:hypothetical protein
MITKREEERNWKVVEKRKETGKESQRKKIQHRKNNGRENKKKGWRELPTVELSNVERY